MAGFRYGRLYSPGCPQTDFGQESLSSTPAISLLTSIYKYVSMVTMKPEVKYKTVALRIRIDQYQTFKKLKEIRGVSMSHVLRQSLDDYIKLAGEQANV